MAEKIKLTKSKVDSLKKELDQLKNKKREDLSEALERARQNDVSEETGDIIAVMEELEKVDQRIAEIKETLKNVVVIDKKSCNVDKIAIGTDVKVEVGGKKRTLTIVSEVEADPSKNKISDKSPLGKQLIKAKEGDEIKLDVAGRKISYKILEIC
ncbi:MAG: Transcription elongation factor GreA [candidate division WS6 bacterium 36_33]|uniref:Transcription elongation factor GreA n=1 Tax=candidate division WS6 bacterium 36_33 TaxID=1641388 RepID=A0A101GZR7_9BACT|nr:MAG: Transcription elongation factor GreA [candidate division WS6 bacterium 36_33]